MCESCGCNQKSSFTILKPGDETFHKSMDNFIQDHHHEGPGDHHTHEKGQHSHEVVLNQDILHINNLRAERNRGYLEAKNILTLNLVSSPGSGKTCIIEKTIKDLSLEMEFSVIEGDQQTTLDAERIHNTGCQVIQINTGNGCHLDAEMVNKAILKLDILNNSVLVIENVGNLVCPALFDLGESLRIVIISVTEGDDKPLKYPNMFHSSDICIINKLDLLPYVDFNVEKCKENALRINNRLRFLDMSVKSGAGLKEWYDWLRKERKKLR